MKKIDLDKRLDARATGVAVVAVLLVLVVAFVVAIVAHQGYLKNRTAEIVGFKSVYVYSDSATEVDLADIVTVSKGASYSVTKVTNKSLDVLPSSTKFDVREKQTYYVFIKVVNEGYTRAQDYLLTITADKNEQGPIPENTPVEINEIITE